MVHQHNTRIRAQILHRRLYTNLCQSGRRPLLQQHRFNPGVLEEDYVRALF